MDDHSQRFRLSIVDEIRRASNRPFSEQEGQQSDALGHDTLAVFSQSAFRWRNDDGSESGATWKAAENVNPAAGTLALDTNHRIRIEVEETATASPAANLFETWQYRKNGGAWTTISTLTTNVRAVSSPNVADNVATTNQLTTSTRAFVAGHVTTDGNQSGPFMSNNNTESELVFQLRSADLVTGDIIELRLNNGGGTPLDVYAQTPSYMVVANNEPFVRAFNSAGGVSGTNLAISSSVAAQTGDLIYLVMNQEETLGTATATGFTQVAQWDAGLTNRVTVLRKTAVGGETSFTINKSTTSWRSGAVVIVGNPGGTEAIGTAFTDTGSGTAMGPASASSAVGALLLLMAGHRDGSVRATPPSGMTEVVDFDNVWIGRELNPSGGSPSRTATLASANTNRQAILLAIPPISTTPTVTGQVTMAGIGAVNATGRKTLAGAATIAGTGAVNVTGNKVLSGAETIAGTATVNATGSIGSVVTASATMPGTSALTPTGLTVFGGIAHIVGTGIGLTNLHRKIGARFYWPMSEGARHTAIVGTGITTGWQHLSDAINNEQLFIGQNAAFEPAHTRESTERAWSNGSAGDGYLQTLDSINMPDGAEARTVMFTFRRPLGTEDGTILSYGTSGVTRQSFGLKVVDNDTLQFWSWGDDWNVDLGFGLDDDIHHLAAVYDGATSLKLYLATRDAITGALTDHGLIADFTLGGVLNTIISVSGLVIGRDYFSLTGNPYDGEVGSIAVYDGTLTDLQIARLAHATLLGAEIGDAVLGEPSPVVEGQCAIAGIGIMVPTATKIMTAFCHLRPGITDLITGDDKTFEGGLGNWEPRNGGVLTQVDDRQPASSGTKALSIFTAANGDGARHVDAPVVTSDQIGRYLHVRGWGKSNIPNGHAIEISVGGTGHQTHFFTNTDWQYFNLTIHIAAQARLGNGFFCQAFAVAAGAGGTLLLDDIEMGISANKTTVIGAVSKIGASTIAGIGALVATGKVDLLGRSTMAGSAVVSASGTTIASVEGQATLAGTGALTGAGAVVYAARVTMAGLAAMIATGGFIRTGTATMAGTGALIPLGRRVHLGETTIAGTGALSPKGTIARLGLVTMHGQATPIFNGSLRIAGKVTFAGQSSPQFSAFVIQFDLLPVPGTLGRIHADAYDPSGVKLDFGALNKIFQFRYTERLDAIGDFEASIPADDERIAYLARGTELRFYREGEGEVFRGIVARKERVIADNEFVCQITGRSVGEQLVRLTTKGGRAYQGATLAAFMADILTGTGWAIGTLDVPSTQLLARFDWATLIDAIASASEQFKLHHRTNTIARTVDVGAFGAASGMTFANVRSMSPLIRQNEKFGIIADLTLLEEGEELWNRIIMLGGGEGVNRTTMQYSTRVSPYTIQTVATPEPYWFIEDAASISAHGLYERALVVKEAVPLANSIAGQQAVGNALYDIGVNYLQKHKDEREEYTVKTTGIRHYSNGVALFKVGDTARTIFSGFAQTAEGEQRVWKSIDEPLYILEFTRTIMEDGTDDWSFDVSTVDRKYESYEEKMVDAFSHIHALDVSLKNYTFQSPYLLQRQSIDATHTATLYAKLDANISLLHLGKLTFIVRPLRSNVSVAASGGGATSSGGSPHSHSVTGATSGGGGGSHGHSVTAITSATNSGSRNVVASSPFNIVTGGPSSVSTGLQSAQPPANHDHSMQGHSHSVVSADTIQVADHNHTHGVSGQSASSQSIDHSHSVSGQTASNESTHTHTVSNHTHPLTYGIFQATNPTNPGITITINGVSRTVALGGPFNSVNTEVTVDITQYLQNGATEVPVQATNTIVFGASLLCDIEAILRLDLTRSALIPI